MLRQQRKSILVDASGKQIEFKRMSWLDMEVPFWVVALITIPVMSGAAWLLILSIGLVLKAFGIYGYLNEYWQLILGLPVLIALPTIYRLVRVIFNSCK